MRFWSRLNGWVVSSTKLPAIQFRGYVFILTESAGQFALGIIQKAEIENIAGQVSAIRQTIPNHFGLRDVRAF
jgi:hypothetical protein